MQLVVAEKPSVARDLARVLGVRPTGAHAFEGSAHVITWCIGHLVELEEPAAYDGRWKAWRLDTLPMVPAEFRLRPARHAVGHLRAVARLLRDRRFRSVVNACDAGREGELIFRYVYQYAGGGPPVLRLWISSLTDEAIRRGFAALRPGAQLDPLADAARARAEADGLVGMNAPRAVTVHARGAAGPAASTAERRGGRRGKGALFSLGRVQTPTLAMLVEREQAIRAFVSRPYWEVRAELRTAAGQGFRARWQRGDATRLATAGLAEAIAARDRGHGAAADPAGPRVEQVRARTIREPPPLLFDLTSLQRTANRRFGFAAARTLAIAQALYERHKVLTYPRTDSRHLASDQVAELPALFEALGAIPAYAAFAARLRAHPPRPGKRIVDDAKVRDHHAIIPTARLARADGLDRDEQRVFDLVARRFLGAFFPDAELAATEVWIRVGPGGGAIPPDGKRAAGEEPPILDALPPLPDRYRARGRVRLVAGWQEVAGIDGGEERGARGERGEGDADADAALPPLAEGDALDGAFAIVAKQTTPPPRYTEATLLAAMESAGKKLDTDELRAAMKDRGLGTPATRAAIIETLLAREFVTRAKQALVPTALGIGLIEALPVASLASPELTGAWEARLARVARGEDSRAAFMADIARYVAEMVDAIRGTGPAPARSLEATAPARGTEVALACPRCRAGSLITGSRGWGCARWREGCGFVVWFETAGRRLTAAQLRDLVTRGKTRKARFAPARGEEGVAGRLVLDPAADGGAARFEPA